MSRKAVITGVGLVTSLGIDVEENWQKALAGRSGVSELRLPGANGGWARAVGAVPDRDWKKIEEEFPGEAQVEGERRTLFALWATKLALTGAGLIAGAKRADWGVLFAAGVGIVRPEDIHRWLGRDGSFDLARFGAEYSRTHRDSIVRHHPHRAASLIAKKFGLSGLNCTVTSACASSTQAIGLGFRAIQRGDTDVIIAGGSDSMIHPFGLLGFALLKASAESFVEPQTACRPFDRKRSGLVIGEGAGVAILEEEGHALARGARIYGEVCGYSSSMDAYQVTAPHPQGLGAALCMRNALRDSGLKPDGIDYINAHGTGTKLNDLAETLAIKEVFKETAYTTPISSSKSLIGHLMAAAGAAEFVFTALSVHRDEIHPTVNLTNPDPKCDLDYVPNVKRLRRVGAALSNSFGFGGQNASIVIKKHGEPSAASLE